jgi:hypothetical protein
VTANVRARAPGEKQHHITSGREHQVRERGRLQHQVREFAEKPVNNKKRVGMCTWGV